MRLNNKIGLWFILTFLYLMIPTTTPIQNIGKIGISWTIGLLLTKLTKTFVSPKVKLLPAIKRYYVSILLAFLLPIGALVYSLWPLTARPPLSTVFMEGVFYAFLVGFYEEFLFRGLLYKGLREYFSAAESIVVSSFLFGVSHFFGMSGLSVTVIIVRLLWNMSLGFYLGALMEKTDNLSLVSLIHMLIDFSLVVYLFSEQSFYPSSAAFVILATYYSLGAYGLYLMRKK